MEKIDRRKFIKKTISMGAGALILGAGCSGKQENNAIPENQSSTDTSQNTELIVKDNAHLGIAKSLKLIPPDDPEMDSLIAELTRRAIDSIGGISRFVKKGDDVIVKPNICTDYYSYEYAATSNPVVVGTIVGLCLQAGAKRVRVMDNTVRGMGNAEKGYKISGIQDAVEKAGGKMELMNPIKFRKTAIPNGVVIKSWPIYQDILNADVVINVPIPKDHPATELTAGCKNLMGIIGSPTKFHDSLLSERIVDIATVVRPALTVIDAIRILMHNGPTGGSLSDVKITNIVAASHDMITADSYATTLFSLTAEDILHIKLAGERGLGITDLSTITIKEVIV